MYGPVIAGGGMRNSSAELKDNTPLTFDVANQGFCLKAAPTARARPRYVCNLAEAIGVGQYCCGDGARGGAGGARAQGGRRGDELVFSGGAGCTVKCLNLACSPFDGSEVG
ncbi:hypothetical protein EVAR_71524_1 [Eumeta japonica]|uniref:Uncharacterized protein n=1 Tax=Eumeta variegata TaxID=151549 RepID=A0A4C1TAN7_EUMVA|nr:hypothetical protein EVAR_71524_1 [Eumeta japonica]